MNNYEILKEIMETLHRIEAKLTPPEEAIRRCPCGDIISGSEEFCSKECADNYY